MFYEVPRRGHLTRAPRSLNSPTGEPRFSILSSNGKLPFPDPFPFSSPKIKNSCAAGETRTPKPLRVPVPKTGAYTNSATAAYKNFFLYSQSLTRIPPWRDAYTPAYRQAGIPPLGHLLII